MPAVPAEARDAALMAVAQGATQEEAAKIAGVTQSGVSRWLSVYRARREKLDALLSLRWLRRTVRGEARIHESLMGVVEDQRLDGKGRPLVRGSDKAQAANVILSHAMPAGPEALTIQGDVNVSQNVQVDARSLHIAREGTAAERAAEIARLRAELGF